MISRYSRPEMSAIWSEEAKLARWLEIEILACEGMANRRIIPRKTLDDSAQSEVQYPAGAQK